MRFWGQPLLFLLPLILSCTERQTSYLAARSEKSDASTGEEACVDRWLAERSLDEYGSPRGTMYAGGTPLFDEATGKRQDRLEHIYSHHPEARAVCASRGR
jgi:hypothetical protein